jgi:hypothetical protein
MVSMIRKSLIAVVSVLVALGVRAAIADPCTTGQAKAKIGDRYVQEGQRDEDALADVGEQAKIGGTLAVPPSLSPDSHKDDLTTLPPEGQTVSKMVDLRC